MEFFCFSTPIVIYDVLSEIEVYNDFLYMLTRSNKDETELGELKEKRILYEENQKNEEAYILTD